MFAHKTFTSAGVRTRRRQTIGALLSSWPVWLDRLHLGWLTGTRFLLVTHRGRRTGRLRVTAVMVLHRDERKHEVYAVAGNRRSDWYRNIQASPAVQISMGGRRYRPVQRFLRSEEIASILASCRRRDPVSARIQCLFFGWRWETEPGGLLRLASSLGGVVFRLESCESAPAES